MATIFECHLRFHDIFSVDGEVPELAILFVEVPDVHGVVVCDEFVSLRPLHHVDLRLKVVWFVRLVHLNDAEHNDEESCSDVKVLPLAAQIDHESPLVGEPKIDDACK